MKNSGKDWTSSKRAEDLSLGDALSLFDKHLIVLRAIPGTGRIHPAGSLRRMEKTVEGIDILIETDAAQRVFEAFADQISRSERLKVERLKASYVLENGVQVSLMGVDTGSYGAALQVFTGSKAHNVKLREIARSQGMTINEQGIFKGDKRSAVRMKKRYTMLWV